MQKWLIMLGALLLLLGLIWPWLEKAGLFRLPGDIVIQRDKVRFYFPITTGILISLVISLIIWFLRR